MLAGDSVSTSIMVSSPISDSSLSVQARSDQVIGTAQSLNNSSSRDTATWGALLSGVSVAFMSSFVMGRFLRRRTGYGSRSDIITLIAGLSGVITAPNELMWESHDTTFLRLADLFLLRAQGADAMTKQRCITGLKALLLVNASAIAEESIQVIRQNLELLDVRYTDDEFEKRPQGTNALNTRLKIIKLFEEGNGSQST